MAHRFVWGWETLVPCPIVCCGADPAPKSTAHKGTEFHPSPGRLRQPGTPGPPLFTPPQLWGCPFTKALGVPHPVPALG